MVLPVLGQALMLLAFVAASVGAVASLRAGRRFARAGIEHDPVDIGARALLVVMLAALSGVVALLLALVASDFTFAYVESRTSRDLPLGFRLTALWSGQEGSLLLWLAVLAACGVVMAGSLRRAGLTPAHRAYANGVVLLIASFFAVLVAFVARPFAVVDQLQRDGAGMSPAL